MIVFANYINFNYPYENYILISLNRRLQSYAILWISHASNSVYDNVSKSSYEVAAAREVDFQNALDYL